MYSPKKQKQMYQKKQFKKHLYWFKLKVKDERDLLSLRKITTDT